MKKRYLKRILQSLCFGAIGILVGTSLDYATSGYGFLSNYTAFAESTTTAAASVTLRERTILCHCSGTTTEVINGEPVTINTVLPGSATYCNRNGDGKECAPESVPTVCVYSYFKSPSTLAVDTCKYSR